MARSGTTPASYSGGRLLAVLLVTMAASTLMQFSLGVLAPFITADLGLSAAAVGAAGSVLFLSGLATSVSAGVLAGRWGDVVLLRAVSALVLVAIGTMAVAPGWAWILAAAVVAGVPLGIANPATNGLIARRVDRAVQGTATGIKQAGVQLAPLVAGTAGPVIAAGHGWRAALGALALVPLLGLVLSSRLGRSRDAGRTSSPPPARRSPTAVFLSGYAVMMGCGVGGVIAFLPLFAVHDLGLSPGRAGQLIALMGLVGGAARIVAGVLGDKVERFEVWLAALAGLAAASVGCLLATSLAGWLGWVAAGGLGASAIAWQTPAMLAIVREGTDTARSSGLVMSGFLAGMTIGPVLFGGLVDRTGSYAAGWWLVTGAFAAAAVTALRRVAHR